MAESDFSVNLGDRLIEARLLTAAEWEKLQKEVEKTGHQCDDTKLAAELVEREIVTEWQLKSIDKQNAALYLENDRYLLLDEIGRGGMGAVYKARHTRMNRVVALKVIDAKRATDQGLIDRFRREVEVSARLQHEHIVQALDVGEHEKVSFLVLEYVEGSDLAALVKRDGVMSPDEAAAIGMQAAAGLAYAHAQGIIHRDIKPQNILLSTAGVTKILDMGLARIEKEADDVTETGLTQDGAVMGTLDYMAPEQASDAHSADARADLYALGATLYFLLTGRPPFVGGKMMEKLHRLANEEPQPVGQLRPDCPRELTDLVQQLLRKDPSQRPQTAEEVVRVLKPLAAERISGRPVVTASVQTAADTRRETGYAQTVNQSPTFALEEPPGTVMSVRRRPQSSLKVLWWAIGLAVFVSMSVGVGFWVTGDRADKTDGEPKVEQAKNKPIVKPPAGPPAGFRVEFPGHYGDIQTFEWSPDGSKIATGGGDGEVRIWDVDKKETIRTYRGHYSWPYTIAWSPKGDLIASADWRGEIHIWNTDSGERVARFTRALSAPHYAITPTQIGAYVLAFSPDGSEFVYGERNKVVRIRLADWKPFSVIATDATQISWSPDSRLLACVSGGTGEITVWDLEKTKTILSLPKEKLIQVASFLSDNTLAVAVNEKVTIRNPRTGESLGSFPLPTALLNQETPHIQFSRDGERCLIGEPRGVTVVDLRSGRKTKQAVSLHENRPFWRLSPAMRSIAYWNNDAQVVRLANLRATSSPWNFLSVDVPPRAPELYDKSRLSLGGNQVLELKAIESVEFPDFPHVTSDGRLLAIVRESDPRQFTVVEFPGLRKSPPSRTVAVLEDTADYPDRLIWTADGRRIRGFSLKTTSLRLWDAQTGKIVRTHRFPISGEISRAFSTADETGNVIAATQGDKIYAWRNGANAPSIVGNLFSTELDGTEFQEWLRLSANGQVLAGGRGPSHVYLWDVATGKRLHHIETGVNASVHMKFHRFSKSDRYLFATRGIWEVQTGKRIWKTPERAHAVGLYSHWVTHGGWIFDDERHVVIGQDAEFQIWDFIANKKKATIFFLPENGWALVNHTTGHWKGSTMAFRYLRLRVPGKSRKDRWLSPYDYEKFNGWKNDPAKARLKFMTNNATAK